MSPQDRLEFNRMKAQLANIQKVEDVSFIESMKRRLGFGATTAAPGASTTGTSIAVRNAADSGSETVADEYDGVLTLTDTQGNSYRIGYYT
jgi:hypothetical protein